MLLNLVHSCIHNTISYHCTLHKPRTYGVFKYGCMMFFMCEAYFSASHGFVFVCSQTAGAIWWVFDSLSTSSSSSWWRWSCARSSSFHNFSVRSCSRFSDRAGLLALSRVSCFWFWCCVTVTHASLSFCVCVCKCVRHSNQSRKVNASAHGYAFECVRGDLSASVC